MVSKRVILEEITKIWFRLDDIENELCELEKKVK